MILTGGLTPALSLFFGKVDMGTMIYAATTLIGFLGLLLRLRADNKAAKAAAEAAATALAAQLSLDATRVRNQVDKRADVAERHAEEVKGLISENSNRLSNEIADNTDISRNAFREANQVNAKIASLGQTLVAKKNAEPASEALFASLESIRTTVETKHQDESISDTFARVAPDSDVTAPTPVKIARKARTAVHPKKK